MGHEVEAIQRLRRISLYSIGRAFHRRRLRPRLRSRQPCLLVEASESLVHHDTLLVPAFTSIRR